MMFVVRREAFFLDHARDLPPVRAVADDDPSPGVRRQSTCGGRGARERDRQHVKSLVEFQASRTQQDDLVAEAVALP